MNFYIGNSISDINASDENIEFSDELIEFIYKLNTKSPFDMNKLCEINPYADVEISKKDLSRIIDICNCILRESALEDYEEPDEGTEMLLNLVQIAQKALKEEAGLVSVGD